MAAAATFLPTTPTPRLRLAVLPTSRNRPAPICAGATDDAPPPDAEADEEVAQRSGGKDSRRAVRIAWEKLVRWSRSWRRRNRSDVVETTRKVVVLGGGSSSPGQLRSSGLRAWEQLKQRREFGTAMAAQVAAKKADLEVAMLLRDDLVCRSINHSHINCKYLPEYRLPENIIATTSASDALAGADLCFHAVRVQFILS